MKIAAVIAVSLLIGCGVSQMASLSVSKIADASIPNSCKTGLTLTNLFPHRTIRPVVTLLVFDSAGNTLDQRTTYFDVIMPGKQQFKEIYINATCATISKIHVYRAYDPDMESIVAKNHYFPLRGVHDITFSFNP